MEHDPMSNDRETARQHGEQEVRQHPNSSPMPQNQTNYTYDQQLEYERARRQEQARLDEERKRNGN
jgi:hypothetical protein